MAVIEFEKIPDIIPNPGGQAGFAEDWEHFVIALEGGWGSGKTFIGSRKLITLHLWNAFETTEFDSHGFPAGKPTFVPHLVIAPTYGNIMDFDVPALYDALDSIGLSYKFRASGAIAGGRFYGPAIILPDLGTQKNPSLILLRTADAPAKITGFEVGGSWCDESARWKGDKLNPLNDPILQVGGRVRHPRANLLMIMHTYTNEGDNTRVYEEMHAGRSDHKLYRAATYENPIMDDFCERQKATLTPELVEQYIEGKAANFRGGKVYGQYDEHVNQKEDVEFRPDIPMQLSLDFNISPGMHGLLGQYHPDKDIFTAVHEIHASRLDVRGLCDKFEAKIKELNWDWKRSGPLEVYGDASGGSEWAGTGESCYMILRQKLDQMHVPYRIRVPKANPPVIDRVNAVNCALKDVAGDVHYYIHPRCKRLIDDLSKMQRDEYGEIDKMDKKLSHASDADGYRIWYVRPLRIASSGVGGRIIVQGQ